MTPNEDSSLLRNNFSRDKPSPVTLKERLSATYMGLGLMYELVLRPWGEAIAYTYHIVMNKLTPRRDADDLSSD